jgi:hypothetical protein
VWLKSVYGDVVLLVSDENGEEFGLPPEDPVRTLVERLERGYCSSPSDVNVLGLEESRRRWRRRRGGDLGIGRFSDG